MSNDTIVYSTDSGRIKPNKKSNPAPSSNLDGIIRIRRETKGRKGKGVTTVSGIDSTTMDIKALASELKKLCGTGGAVKQEVIEIQGDNKDKIKQFLEGKGLKVKLAGG